MRVDLLKFYQNKAKNNRGVTLEQIWNYSDKQLEKNHHFIQWLFPTDQKSKFNWTAPVLNKSYIIMLKNDAEVMCNFRKSLEVFLPFLGFNLNADDSVVFADDFNDRSKIWITKNNHNYKRISRILRFLTLFKFDTIKTNFIQALEDVYDGNKETIGEVTYNTWKNIWQQGGF